MDKLLKSSKPPAGRPGAQDAEPAARVSADAPEVPVSGQDAAMGGQATPPAPGSCEAALKHCKSLLEPFQDQGPCKDALKVLLKSLGAVSYTHLRAHETSAHL
eukprot:1526876-Alexandrium_andersonii.AAC.1